MAERFQMWSPDTHPGLDVLLAVDEETGAIRVRGVAENGVLTGSKKDMDNLSLREKELFKGHEVKIDPKAAERGNKITDLNVYKNAELIPAIIAALPEDAKEQIETRVSFIAVGDELHADFTKIDPAYRGTAQQVFEQKRTRTASER
jgi:hypothetical protein